MNVIDTVGAPLSIDQMKRIARIDAEDFSGVARKVRDEAAKRGDVLSDGFVNEGILALKQFYAAIVVNPDTPNAVSDVLDPFWHFHILHTMEYAKFCQDVFGYFLHHRPLNHAIAADVDAARSYYATTTATIEETFSYVNRLFRPEQTDSLICWGRADSDTHVICWAPSMQLICWSEPALV